MKILKKLTLVILTYERPKYLKRLLEFYEKIDINILIIDGSNSNNLNLIKKYLNNRVKYLHKPINYKNRIELATKLVKTEYVLTGCDDEFYSVNGLIKILNELEKNKNLVACKGVTLGFFKYKSSISWTFEYPRHLNYKRFEKDALIRVAKHISKYPHTLYYSIVRKDVWIKSFSTYLKEELSINAQSEIMFEINVSFFGIHSVIPVLHHFRSFESSSIISNDISLQAGKYEFYEICKQGLSNDVGKRLIENLSLIVPKKMKDEFKSMLQKNFLEYSKYFLSYKMKIKLLLKLIFTKTLLNKLKKIIQIKKEKI